MKIKWEMTIGYATAKRRGTVEIDDEYLEGKSAEEIEEAIHEAIWEDAVQLVEVYPVD